MSGYAKRMMAAAAPWMEANPVPFAGRITVPRIRIPTLKVPLEIERAALARERTSNPIRALAADKDRSWSVLESTISSDEDIDRLERAIKRHGDRAASLVQARKQVAGDLESNYSRLEEVLNRRYPDGPGTHTMNPGDAPMPLEDLFGLALGGWLLSWGHEGYNVFDLSPDFVAAMLLTDPSALLGEREIRLPFRGLLLLLPDGFARDGDGSFTKLHVSTLSGGEGGDILEIVAVSGARAVQTAAYMRDVAVDGVAAFEDDRDCGEADMVAMETVRRIVLGTVGYLAMAPTGRVERETSQRRRERAGRASPKIWDLGREIRLDPNLVRAARCGSREVALRLRYRHIVRGHYRNQPIGEGRKGRKTIWIAPFWKGPADGAAIVHTYKPAVQPDDPAEGAER